MTPTGYLKKTQSLLTKMASKLVVVDRTTIMLVKQGMKQKKMKLVK
jgi:hypothetical protein